MEPKNTLHNIALHLDLFNTVSGGISETYATVEKHTHYAVIEVWAAGVEPKIFEIILNGNNLTVCAVKNGSHSSEVTVPFFHQTFILPPAINVAEMETVYQNGKLKITLPYFKWARQHRDIKIEQIK